MPNALKALVIGFCVMLASCSGPQSVKDARGDIDIFHGHLDTGNIDAIWQTASLDLTGSTPKAKFAGFLAGVHEKLGNVVASEQTGWKRNVNTGGSFVTVNMETTFERGIGKEEFVFRYVDDELRLGGYHITWKVGQPGAADEDAESGGKDLEPESTTTRLWNYGSSSKVTVTLACISTSPAETGVDSAEASIEATRA